MGHKMNGGVHIIDLANSLLEKLAQYVNLLFQIRVQLKSQ